MTKCQQCIHQSACEMWAEPDVMQAIVRKCTAYERKLAATGDIPIDVLKAVLAQSEAGMKHYKNDRFAYTWFSRIHIIADMAQSEITGAELSKTTLDNEVYKSGYCHLREDQ